MGPLLLLLIFSLGPIISLRGAADTLGCAHCILLLLLPIYSIGPIISLGAAANELGWAHCQCCRLSCIGSLFLLEVLPMSSGGTIAAAADFLSWAHYFFGRSSRYTQMVPLHLAAAFANLLD